MWRDASTGRGAGPPGTSIGPWPLRDSRRPRPVGLHLIPVGRPEPWRQADEFGGTLPELGGQETDDGLEPDREPATCVVGYDVSDPLPQALHDFASAPTSVCLDLLLGPSLSHRGEPQHFALPAFSVPHGAVVAHFVKEDPTDPFETRGVDSIDLNESLLGADSASLVGRALRRREDYTVAREATAEEPLVEFLKQASQGEGHGR